MHIDRFPTSAAAINQLNQTDFVSMYFVTSIIKRWIDAPQEGRSSGRIVRLCHQKYPAGFVNSAEDERDEMSDRSGSKDYSLESRYRTVLYPTSILRQTRKWGFLWFTFQLFPGFFFFSFDSPSDKPTQSESKIKYILGNIFLVNKVDRDWVLVFDFEKLFWPDCVCRYTDDRGLRLWFMTRR